MNRLTASFEMIDQRPARRVQGNRPLRVLAITPKLPRPEEPGSNAPLMRQIESLRARGIEVEVIDMRGRPIVKYLMAVPRMWKRLKQVDLVHSHFGFCGWLGRLQFSKPLVISFMGDDLLGEPTDDGQLTWFSRLMVRANRWLAKLARRVIVKSAEMSSVIGTTESHVVPNGVDIDLFRPIDRRSAREQLGWKQDQQVILFPGNPHNPRKGHDLAVAATKVSESILNDEIRIQTMWGVRPEQVPLYMNASDAMWMTSSIEGSPNVVKEAMACNLPIVAVPVGDVEYLLRHVPGCSVHPRDPQMLGEAMAQLLGCQGESAGRDALQRMELDIDSVAVRVEEIYYSALGRPYSNDASRDSDSSCVRDH